MEWPRRRELILAGLLEAAADVILLQEVDLTIDQANGLCASLNVSCAQPYQAYHVAGPRRGVTREGLAALARVPVTAHDGHDLLFEERIAQRLQVEVEGRPVDCWNIHLHHPAGEAADAIRLRQASTLLEWFARGSASVPFIAAGDFNSVPGSPAYRCLGLRSAFAEVHGRHPVTTRTPLGSDDPERWRAHSPVDHVLLGPGLVARSASLVLDEPAPGHPDVWPSDHRGVLAEIDLVAGHA